MKKQLHSIDRMKVTANYMRCMIHCLVPYMVYNHGMWFFQAEPRLKGIDVLVFVLHSFVMELFILLSGYLTYSSFTPWKRLLTNQWMRIIKPCLKASLLTIPLLYLSKSVYTEYLLPPPSIFSINHIFKTAVHLLYTDVKEHGLPIAHYWYLLHLLIYVLVANLFKKWPLFVVVAFLIMGLAINKDGIIRNPVYLEIKWPAMFYYFGFFLLGRWLKQEDYQHFNFKLNTVRCMIIFLIHLALSGIYLEALQSSKNLPYASLILPYSLVISALSGCAWFAQWMQQAKWKPSKFIANINFKIYLYHLPVAIIFQLFFLEMGATGLWVPLSVFLLSTGVLLAFFKVRESVK